MFEFINKNRGLTNTVFMLALDKKKKTERVIIGEAGAIKLRLERNISDVLYDKTRPLGRLLLDFEKDPDKEWQLNASYMADNFAGLTPTKNVESRALKPYIGFLEQKYMSGEPTAMFAAVKTWEIYWQHFKGKDGSEKFLNRVGKLYRPFFGLREHNLNLWQLSSANVMSAVLFTEESQIELWQPLKKRNARRGECVVTSSSFIPIIFYYLERFEEWGLQLKKCKICGTGFLAESRHYELCSNKCRKVTAVAAKQQYEEKIEGDKVVAAYENHYQYWYNRGRRLKRNNAPDEEIAEFTKAFNKFRKGAIKRKAEVKSGDLSFMDFSTWLFEQQEIVDGLVKHGR
ncbi:MAG: hypothetical protein LBC82_05510 [Oscillospiraceae bacterium]|jgi:hypothetical protein|nr:hypothetical protein [Oscillospiraceae bacterium]